MTKTTNRTPTPWRRNIPPAIKYPTIYAGRNTHILHMATSGRTAEAVEADTEFMLRAANSHGALVAALEGMIELGCDDQHDQVLANAIAALTLAKGA